MATAPTGLRLTAEGGLAIDWSNGTTRVYTARELYAVNPAADARAERERRAKEAEENKAKVGNLMLTVIKPEETQPRRVIGVQPVGNYAYMIRFNHGSSNGLYRLELLQELGTSVPYGSSAADGNQTTDDQANSNEATDATRPDGNQVTGTKNG